MSPGGSKKKLILTRSTQDARGSSLGNLYTFLVGDPQKKGGRVDLIKKSVTIASTDSVQKSVVTCFATARIFFEEQLATGEFSPPKMTSQGHLGGVKTSEALILTPKI